MSARERLTLAAGLAVALTSSAFTPVFEDLGWASRVLGAVLVVALTGLAARRLDLPTALQPALGLAALGYYLCAAFVGGTLRLGLVPGGASVHALQQLVHAGRLDVSRFGPPVPTHAGMVLLCAAGVGAVALVVDLLAVVLSRAAVAGLPLLLLFAIPSGLVPGGLGWLPFSLGAAGWLGVLLVEGGDRVGRWGAPLAAARPTTRSVLDDDTSLGRVGRRIGAAALSLAVVVPALLPGLDARLLGGGSGAGPGTGGGSRTATTYNPITRLHAELALPKPRQLLAYTSDDPQPDYLRMTTLDTYDGQGWSASKLEADRQQAKVGVGIPAGVGDNQDAAHRDVTMRIAIDTLDVHWLPVPFGPRGIKVNGSWLWDRESETAFSATRSTRGLKAYTVRASRVLPARTALSTAVDIDSAVVRRYGGSLEVVPWVQTLTNSLIRGAISPYDRALAIQRYFRTAANGFRYDLTSSGPTRDDPDLLSSFLHGKRGFCEQYATAMAVLLRQAGVPSRVAVGFTPGTKLPGRNVYEVTTSDAHAWPEAWFSGLGWIRFEPTPSLARTVVPDYSLLPTDAGGQVTPLPPTGQTPGATSAQNGKSPGKLLGNGADALGGGAAAGSGSRGHLGVPTPVLLIALIALLAALPALAHAVRRRRRWRVGGPLVAWRQVQDDAIDVRHRWHAADSPRAAAAGLLTSRALPPAAAAALERIAVATERARYARPGAAVDADQTLEADSRSVRAALLADTGTRSRWRARLLPASTLTWASSGAGTAVADLLDRSDVLTAAVSRRLRPRRRPA